MIMKIDDIRDAVARGWCYDINSNKEMDANLAEAISQEVHKLFIADKEPYLGCATTKELLDEIAARSDLDYKTVNTQ